MHFKREVKNIMHNRIKENGKFHTGTKRESWRWYGVEFYLGSSKRMCILLWKIPLENDMLKRMTIFCNMQKNNKTHKKHR